MTLLFVLNLTSAEIDLLSLTESPHGINVTRERLGGVADIGVALERDPEAYKVEPIVRRLVASGQISLHDNPRNVRRVLNEEPRRNRAAKKLSSIEDKVRLYRVDGQTVNIFLDYLGRGETAITVVGRLGRDSGGPLQLGGAGCFYGHLFDVDDTVHFAYVNGQAGPVLASRPLERRIFGLSDGGRPQTERDIRGELTWAPLRISALRQTANGPRLPRGTLLAFPTMQETWEWQIAEPHTGFRMPPQALNAPRHNQVARSIYFGEWKPSRQTPEEIDVEFFPPRRIEADCLPLDGAPTLNFSGSGRARRVNTLWPFQVEKIAPELIQARYLS